MEQALFTQRAFFKLINDELRVNTYFYRAGRNVNNYNEFLQLACYDLDCNLRIIEV